MPTSREECLGTINRKCVVCKEEIIAKLYVDGVLVRMETCANCLLTGKKEDK